MINKCKVSYFLRVAEFGVWVFFGQSEFVRTTLTFSLELGLFEMKENRRVKNMEVEKVDQICC